MNGLAIDHPRGQRPAHRRRYVGLLLALLTLGPGAVLAQTYTTIDCPDSVFTGPRSINDRGEIVGVCEDATGVHGFLLRRGRFTRIDVPDGRATVAFGINNQGDVVGRYIDGSDVLHGFLLRRGRFTTIDPPGSVSTVAQDIDDLGRIVGFYVTSDDAFADLVWIRAATGTSFSRVPMRWQPLTSTRSGESSAGISTRAEFPTGSS